jgi:hypothetical protein
VVRKSLEILSLEPLFDLYDGLDEVQTGSTQKPAQPKKAWSANVRQARAAWKMDRVRATGVCFVGNLLQVILSDGREIGMPLDRVEWLGWLAKATPPGSGPGGPLSRESWPSTGRSWTTASKFATCWKCSRWPDGQPLPAEKEVPQ